MIRKIRTLLRSYPGTFSSNGSILRARTVIVKPESDKNKLYSWENHAVGGYHHHYQGFCFTSVGEPLSAYCPAT